MHDVLEDYFYSEIGEGDDRELLAGELVVREPASLHHEDLSAFLLVLLRVFLEERGVGVVQGSRYPMRLDERWSPEPDVMVVREERRALRSPQRLEGPADLVIEITSASRPRADLRLKLPRYREAKIPEIWLIDHFACSLRAETYGPDGYRATTLGSGHLASTVIPGFWIEVSWLWQEPLPRVTSCLRQILA
jgi:Uma2 family endonuclease